MLLESRVPGSCIGRDDGGLQIQGGGSQSKLKAANPGVHTG